jgi:hypothetical protein
MSGHLQSMRRRLWGAWMAVQVEFQGQYSVQRLQQLNTYVSGLSTTRLVLLFLATPIPCLAVSLLKEVPVLNSPEAGVYENWVFLIRGWAVTGIINATLLIQLGEGAPSLKLTAYQVAFIASLAAAVAMAAIFVICSVTVFPLPFGVLASAPPDVLVMAICLVRIFRPRLRADPTLWGDLKKQVAVVHCQVSLTFIYPVYIYGFLSLTGVYQVLFVAFLPIIKLLAKNWISRSLADSDDQKPQSVIFIVEVFNALYVSNALQSASSWTLTAVIMAIDMAQFWLSMLDVLEVLNEVNKLMAKIPRDHLLAKANFLQVALKILAASGDLNGGKTQSRTDIATPIERFTSFNDSCANLKLLDASRDPSPVEARREEERESDQEINKTRKLFQGARVVPKQSWLSQSNTVGSDDINAIFSAEERALFIQKTTHVLFITEYIVLVEYVEVVLPVVYCTKHEGRLLLLNYC